MADDSEDDYMTIQILESKSYPIISYRIGIFPFEFDQIQSNCDVFFD